MNQSMRNQGARPIKFRTKSYSIHHLKTNDGFRENRKLISVLPGLERGGQEPVGLVLGYQEQGILCGGLCLACPKPLETSANSHNLWVA